MLSPSIRVTAFTLVAAALPHLAFAQGALNPPGPPAPTMKTLDQIEARTPVNATTTPGNNDYEFIINEPGSYYLTGNVVAGKPSGIRINASAVTLDLSGFQVLRPTSASGSIGIHVLAPDCVIKNGSVAGFAFGVSGTVDVSGDPVRAGMLLEIRIRRCGFAAVLGPGWRVDGCSATDNSLAGLLVGDNAVVRNCAATMNQTAGIQVGNGSTLTHCTASENRSTGFVIGDDATVEACTAFANGRDGFRLGNRSQIRSSTANGNGGTSGNVGSGISAGIRALVSGCKANGNRDDGINAQGDSVILDNHASENGKGGDTAAAAGILVSGAGSRIEGNHVRDNTGHGVKAGTNDVIIRNTAGNNSMGNYDPSSGTYVGPTNQTPSTAGANPNANFQF